jgi:pimeloyl-ACP methyl ester carboxylesterase
MKKFTISVIFLFGILYSNSAVASCGSITTLVDRYIENSPTELKEIEDCDNPFAVNAAGYPYQYFINDQPIIPGVPVLIPADGIRRHYPNYPVFYYDVNLYLHTPAGFTEMSLRYVRPSAEKLTEYVDAFTAQDPTYYNELWWLIYSIYSGEPYPEDINLDDYPETFWDDYAFPLMEYVEGVNEYSEPLYPGTYTVVAVYQGVRLSMTFVLVATDTELPKAGAPSMLFLPGIMGSRLYEDGSLCGEDGEVSLWPSTALFADCKQLRLQMNEAGDSRYNIYTKADQSAVIDEIFGFNLYKSFLSDLGTWQVEGVIADYQVVPYDWRLRLGDILKTKQVGDRIVFDPTINYTESFLYQSLARLATTSTSEVTIVTHSNGGLVAKDFLAFLEENQDPLLARVKNVIFIGVPQSGTPEAVIGMLHGSPLGPFGSVVTQETSRQLLASPFGSHLLPSDEYFSQASSPVITFVPGEATDSFIATYGTEITTKATLHDFLSDSNRPMIWVRQRLLIRRFWLMAQLYIVCRQPGNHHFRFRSIR